MKPGTSARKSSGTLNALQVQMKRAALSEESTNSTPPSGAAGSPRCPRRDPRGVRSPRPAPWPTACALRGTSRRRRACRSARARRTACSRRRGRCRAAGCQMRAPRAGRLAALPVRPEVGEVALGHVDALFVGLHQKVAAAGHAGVHAAPPISSSDTFADHHLGHPRRAEVHRRVAVAHDRHVAEGRCTRRPPRWGRTARTPAARRRTA